VEWQDRNHFFAIAARSMRRILVEHARKRLTGKRGGGRKLPLDEARIEIQGADELRLDLVFLDEALTKLEAIDPRPAQVVELKFFGGMSNEEAAQALGVSVSSVKRDWKVAKAWLRVELEGR
jgi:RNA polymerase sigma factor (TIGR02999 family)